MNPPRNGTYRIAWVLRDIAMIIRARARTDIPDAAIRRSIHRHIADWRSAGFKVSKHYNHARAVARVRQLAAL